MFLALTYDWEAGSSPTRIVTSPGTMACFSLSSVTSVFNTNLAGRILFRVCNASAKKVDAPLGAWAYVVWR